MIPDGDFAFKQTTTYDMNASAPYLRTTAAATDDTWDVPDHAIAVSGGATQYYMPNRAFATVPPMKFWPAKEGEYDDIASRAQFRERLDEVLALAERGLAKAPGDPALSAVTRQLQAMKRNTSNGRNPTETERKNISAGVISFRELRGSPDDDVARVDELIHSVVAFYQDWPEDAVAASLAVGARP